MVEANRNMSILRRKTDIGYGLAFLLLITIGAVSYWTTALFVHEVRLVAHTHNVLGTLAQLESQVQAVIIGQRNYILTGNESVLDSYESGI